VHFGFGRATPAASNSWSSELWSKNVHRPTPENNARKGQLYTIARTDIELFFLVRAHHWIPVTLADCPGWPSE